MPKKNPENEAELIENDPLLNNKKLAEQMFLIAEYYDLARDTYRAKAFRSVAVQLSKHNTIITSGQQAQQEMTGIGPSNLEVINKYLITGKITRLELLEAEYGDAKRTIDLFKSIFGIGTVTAFRFYKKGDRTLQDLWYKESLTEAQKIGIYYREHFPLRIPRHEMDEISRVITSYLEPYGIVWTITGSYRRGEATSGDLDMIIKAQPDFNLSGVISTLRPILPADLSLGFNRYLGVVRLSDNYNAHRLDILLVQPESYACALLHFTGSQRFNILMRSRALSFAWRLNEYHLYDNTGSIVPTMEEKDIFDALRVKYLTPEERIRTMTSLETF